MIELILLERSKSSARWASCVKVKPGFARTICCPEKSDAGDKGEFGVFRDPARVSSKPTTCSGRPRRRMSAPRSRMLPS